MKHKYLGVIGVLVGAALYVQPAQAQVVVEGAFEAQKVCPANKRLTSDNPGEIMTEIGESYAVVGKNREAATHYLIIVPGAEVTERRWVDVACGTAELTAGTTDGDSSQQQDIAPNSIENVLAASWQPTFCATDRGQSKIECQTQTADRPDARQFSIHGLWPDDLDDTNIFPCYCDNGPPVSCRSSLPRVSTLDISQLVRDRLEVLMPGTQSGLHLHEWSKHGTCYEDFNSGDDVGSDPDEYFLDTMAVIGQLNESEVGSLFEDRLGEVVTFEELKTTFDAAFGPGAGDRVVMNCQRIDGQNAVSELWIGLGGQITSDSDLGTLLLAAPTTDNSTTRQSCQSGVVLKVQ